MYFNQGFFNGLAVIRDGATLLPQRSTVGKIVGNAVLDLELFRKHGGRLEAWRVSGKSIILIRCDCLQIYSKVAV